MNDNKDKNIIDKFLEAYDGANEASKTKEYKRVYQRPSKFKCIVGFIFSGLIMFVLLGIFHFSFMYLLIFGVDLLFLLYYGINLFTKKGIGMPKYVKADEYTKNDDINDKYKVQ